MGRNVAPLHFKTDRVAESALRHCDFDQIWLDLPELGGYFPVPVTLN